MEDFERELKEDFLDESMQLLEDSEQAFLQLEHDKNSADLLDQIFRLAHNLKGTSRAVGFGEVAEFTHEMENLILKVKTGDVEITDYVVTVLLECNDHISHMITSLKEDLDATFDSVEIVAKIIGVIEGNAPDSVSQAVDEAYEEPSYEEESLPEASAFEEDAPAAAENWEGLEDELDQILSEHNEEVYEHTAQEEAEELIEMRESGELQVDDVAISQSAIESLRELGMSDEEIFAQLNVETSNKPAVDEGMTIKQGEEVIAKETVAPKVAEAKPIAKPVSLDEKRASNAAANEAANKKKAEDESIRVSLSRVEELNNVVGELVILQTVLEQRRHETITDPLANKSISQLGKLSKEIQEISMSLRMVPLKTTLQKMNRIVRDTSKTLNKIVNLSLVGEETEIDKTVLEHLSDPLVHIVRNAVDHGLEDTEGRIRAGKSEHGNVTIKAFHEGNNLVIEITDDGKGINADIIRKKALEKKLISPNSSIPDHEMIQYIFHPGFSTKEQVTEVSGRGVGMDVVKTNIEKLSGSVQVITDVGVGSTFRVVLPLTMAIIEGMVVRVGQEKYIIPLGQVHESLKPTKEMVHFITGMGECLNLRGEVLPLFNIGNTLARKMDDTNSCEKIAIIVHSSNFNFAVLVDDILHQQQVVIKKLGDEIRQQKGFMGSSILGDGRPSFILDLNELYSSSLKKHKTALKDKLLGKAA
ncbi:putative chemotaxis protein CheA [Bacteriovorax sp. BSW11_IV]|uniref:chemotaxis protein CheA n=1 Tax=Bacteriovorax sp. BSW11_IV TaxID=1353529 RepID=UPI00038A0466|nr:chemotaxis protein CheA [Bacteriovorax sp. BSW11_IV]EQC49896.1 putative chemotaxis protein CheA [Bacteriovorax sp. BSW11_IV]